MTLKFETSLDFFIFFIIIVKIVFIISAIAHLILSYSTIPKAKKIDNKVSYWKERTEFIFIISMAILLIYHFNPRLSKKPIGEETALLFFLFGWILIFTSKWSLFFTEASWYKKFVSALK
jgi:hypothetical protein